MIVLNKAEAEYVLGLSPVTVHGASALEPAPLPSNEYILPEEVMADPANADVVTFLSSQPVREILPEENWNFGTIEDPDELSIAAYNAAKLTWSEPTDERATLGRASRLLEKYGARAARKISGKR
jgi:hypothetical protein